MHKLTRVEAGRLMAVMQETLDKLEVLQVIPVRPSSYFAKELRKDGKQHAADKLQELWSGESNRSSDARLLARGFMRLVFQDTQLRDKLETTAEAPNPVLESFAGRLRDLKAVTERKLLTTVEDADQQKAFIDDVTAKLKKGEEDQANLNSRLNKIRSSKEQEIAALDNTIRTLRGELSYLKQTTEQQAAALAKESEERSMTAKVAHETAVAGLKETIAKLEGEINGMEGEHKVTEAQLRKKKRGQQIGMQNWVTKYDKEVTVSYDKLAKLKEEHEKEAAELAELKEHFRKWDAERERIDAEEREIQREIEQKEAAERALDDAAVMMQCAWRGYKQRKQFRNMKHKKHKGKKSKGKGH